MAIALALGRLGLIALLLWLAWAVAMRLVTRGSEVEEEQPQRGKAARGGAAEPKWQLQVLSVGRSDRLTLGELLPVTGTLLFGRSPECELYLDDNRISRRHAKLELRGAKLVLEDLGSTNGTYVNNRRVTTSVELAPGDVIEIGDTRLKAGRG